MSMREQRTQRGWSQATLAQHAGVSRQLVSAVESGRHEPGVSAALALASALGASVEELFGDEQGTIEAEPVLGSTVPDGPVHAGMIGGRSVVAPIAPLEQLDGVLAHGSWNGSTLELADGAQPASVVLAGCEPALGVLAALSSDRAGALWVKASSGEARAALEAGRVHMAGVHDRADRLPEAPDGVVAFEVARWRVGVAFDAQLVSSAVEALERGGPIAQRERTAGTQAALERWVRRAHHARPAGPRAAGHVEVCRLILAGATVGGVTTEPAAVAAGLGFDALEEHVVQLWCRRELLGDPAVAETLERFTSAAFARRVSSMPAYDVARLGVEVA